MMKLSRIFKPTVSLPALVLYTTIALLVGSMVAPFWVALFGFTAVATVDALLGNDWVMGRRDDGDDNMS